MRAGQGDPRLPALEGEELEAYLRRLAPLVGRDVPQAPALKPMPSDVRLPYREPGEDDDAPTPPTRSAAGPWEDR